MSKHVTVEELHAMMDLADQGLGRDAIHCRLGRLSFGPWLKAYRAGDLARDGDGVVFRGLHCAPGDNMTHRCRETRGAAQNKSQARAGAPAPEQATEVATEVTPEVVPEAEPEFSDGIAQFCDRVVYIDATDIYLFALSLNAGRYSSIAGQKIRDLVQAYSRDDDNPATINECANMLGWPRDVVVEVLRLLGMTHDKWGYTDQDATQRTDSDLVDDTLRRRQWKVARTVERASWDATRREAACWQQFQQLQLNPFVEGIKDFQAGYRVPALNLDRPVQRDTAVFFGTPDFHYGMVSDPFATGFEYNRAIAEQHFLRGTEEIIGDVLRGGQPERWIVGFGSDFHHVDTRAKTTERGTQQHTDGSYARILVEAFRLQVQQLDLLRQTAPEVELIAWPGNHDHTASLALMLALSAKYESSPGVTVRLDPRKRQYIEYGGNLLGLTHGDGVKLLDLPGIMASEARAQWGRAAHHYWFTGHLHHLRTVEEAGATVFQLPALAPPDEWHYDHAYTSSRQAVAAYVLDRERGLRSMLYSPSPDLAAAA